jgi:alanine racemase
MESVPPFRSYALVSREQIARNYRAVQKVVGPDVSVAGVVKADAYGHGAIEVSRTLLAEGARWLAVASVDEGVQLRAGGIHNARILVMGGFLPYEGEALIEFNLTPAIHSCEQIAQAERLAASSGKHLAYHLKIDSGMGRLGTRAPAAEIVAAVHRARYACLEGLMTHLASPGDYTTSQTEEQLAYFDRMCESIAEAGIQAGVLHTSSTVPVGYGRCEGWRNMVRAGIALYGYVSPARGVAPPQVLDVKPALTWKAKLLVVKEVPQGALIGYGGTFRAPSRMRIGIIGAGYADGVNRHLSNRGTVIAAGKLTPILGVVSMDLTTIDLSHTDALKAGDEITLIGTEDGVSIDADTMADVAGTISYEILCGIGARVRRVYV